MCCLFVLNQLSSKYLKISLESFLTHGLFRSVLISKYFRTSQKSFYLSMCCQGFHQSSKDIDFIKLD
uniref:Uncharacterized protein n=1 Tax=Prolemur simus TaxID=1328070 RepID=A0A8C8ZL82_PROSS